MDNQDANHPKASIGVRRRLFAEKSGMKNLFQIMHLHWQHAPVRGKERSSANGGAAVELSAGPGRCPATD